MNAYRKPAEMPAEPMKPKSPHRRIGNGEGSCEPPGVFKRFFRAYTGKSWKCDCGKTWLWREHYGWQL